MVIRIPSHVGFVGVLPGYLVVARCSTWFRAGEYLKFNSNTGHAGDSAAMQALSHFSYHQTPLDVFLPLVTL